MTGKERIEAAFTPAGTPEIGAVICYEGIYERDHWSQLTGHPWWYTHSPSLDDQILWRRDIVARTGQDWISVPSCASRAARERQRIETHDGSAYRIDAQAGTRHRLTPPRPGGEWIEIPTRTPVPDAPGEVDALIPAAPPFDAGAFRRSGACDLADRVRAEFPDLYPLGYVTGPLWALFGIWGFEGLMTMVAERPALCRRAAERQLALALNQVQACQALGARGIWIEECYTDLISPAAFAELNVPLLRELCRAVRKLGMHAIYYYCGNPWDRMAHLLSIGADALSLEEGKKGFRIDVEDVVTAAGGRCVVFGNLDAIGLLEHGSDEELRREIRRQIAAGKRNGSRFVLSIGSPVTPRTPVGRVRRYCDIAHESGTL